MKRIFLLLLLSLSSSLAAADATVAPAAAHPACQPFVGGASEDLESARFGEKYSNLQPGAWVPRSDDLFDQPSESLRVGPDLVVWTPSGDDDVGLVALRPSGGGYCVVGSYGLSWGGCGTVLMVRRTSRQRDGGWLLDLNQTSCSKGYTDGKGRPVPQEEEKQRVQLIVDGKGLRLRKQRAIAK